MTKNAPLIVWNCNQAGTGTAHTRQLWPHNSRGQITVSNGLCLDVENPSVKPGMGLILWNCNGAGQAMQRQRYNVLRDGQIQHVSSGLCVEVGNGGSKGGFLKLQTCNSSSLSQTFTPKK
jgi:hypothetical protein